MWFPWKNRPPADATSLQSLMRRFSDLELLLKGSLAAYRNVLGCMERHVPAVGGPIRDRFRKDLRALVKATGTVTEPAHWDEVSRNLEGTVKRYQRDLEACVRRHEDEAKQVLAMMAVLAESMAARERNYSVRFRDIAKKTRLLVTTQDISLIRQRLSEEMTQLEKYVEDLERDTHQAVARINYDVRTTQERQDSSWDAMPVDPVTDIPGKAMGVGMLEASLRLRNRFGVGIFRILGFDEIERQQGGPVAVEILRQFGPRLQAAFREPDFLCRWGQAEFLLISEETLAQLTARATNVARLLSAAYPVRSGAAIDVRCDFNVVERVGEQSTEQLLCRLEAA